MEIRELDQVDVATTAFRHLLWLAVEVDDDGLDAIVEQELPALRSLGVIEDGGVTAFAAYRVDSGTVLLEYLASAESRRGAGLGRRLLEEIGRRHPLAAIRAQTDDDAIGFYRALGFTDSPAPPDPRWPDRPRYDCVRAAR